MLDIAIVGCGPAGLSAAINSYARNKSVVVFGNGINNSWLYKAENVNNHLGMPNMSGEDMLNKFVEHVNELGIEIKHGRVLQIFNTGQHYMLNFENEIVEAKTVIIATGMNKKSKIANEERLLGKGVSYCATCDGMLYKDKDVAVVIDSLEAMSDVRFLSGICKRVYCFSKLNALEDLPDNVEKINGLPFEIVGDDFVTGIRISDTEVINCNAVFVITAALPITQLISNIKLNNGTIEVTRLMETNLPGLYAAGDCTGYPFQISKAIGEGLIAALQAAKFIDSH